MTDQERTDWAIAEAFTDEYEDWETGWISHLDLLGVDLSDHEVKVCVAAVKLFRRSVDARAAEYAKDGTRTDGRAVHAAWRDGMLAQGRVVSPERMTWETLTEQDRALDDAIAAKLGTKP